VETTLASTDENLMNEYSLLVEDEVLRTRLMNLILSEFHRTRDCLEQLFGESFATRRPRLAKTLNLRSDALLQLHHQQIALLKEWRALCAKGDNTAADEMLPQLLLSINAIASGLRTTG
jgi:phosphoenolpyruvate carboxylase